MKARVVRLVERHGGIQKVTTHRIHVTNRRTGQLEEAWANTILCRDGYRLQLSTLEERALNEQLEDELRALEHETLP